MGSKKFKWPADSPEPIWLEGFGEPVGAYPGKAMQVSRETPGQPRVERESLEMPA